MLVKQSSCCRARDSEQNGAQVDEFSMSSWHVRSDASLKVGHFLQQKRSYLGMKKKEPGKQRKPTSTKLAVIFEDYHST